MISVIIPVYKVEQYLEKCIRSVQNNTYKDIEIICINDGSPDNCPRILERLAAEDPRIRIINQKNRGLAETRSIGLELANGEFIAFIDSDDWIHPQYFQSMHNCMEKTGADMAVCGCLKFPDGEEVAVEKYERIGYQRLKADQFFASNYARHMAWARLYRKENIGRIRFPEEVRFIDDTLFNLRVIANMKHPVVYETDKQLYFYCQRTGSIVREAAYDKLGDYPDWVLRHSDDIGRGCWSWMVLLQAIRLEFSRRYAAKLYKDTREVRQSNRNMRKLLLNMLVCRGLSVKDKIAHIALGCFPSFYRYLRIKDDPTLLEWECNVRGKA